MSLETCGGRLPPAAARPRTKLLPIAELSSPLVRLLASDSIQLREVGIGELEARRGDVLVQVRDAAGAGDRQHHRTALEHPRERHLCGARTELRRHSLQYR